MNELESSLQKHFPFLQKEDLNKLLAISHHKKLQNKEVINHNNKKSAIIFFILKGMVRGFFYDENGVEKTVILKPEFTFSGTPQTPDGQVATNYIFEAINETEILLFTAEQFERRALQSINLARLYIEGLKENMHTLFSRMEMLGSKTSIERYELLIQQNPQFFQKTYNKHIANYLGITPNSLSRIIKKRSQGK